MTDFLHKISMYVRVTKFVEFQDGLLKSGQKISSCIVFLNPFSQLPAVKKDSKNGAARKFFDPSYFVMALIQSMKAYYVNG